MTFLRKLRWLVEGRDPVHRMTRAEIDARIDFIAREWLKTSVDDALAKLERGELAGTVAGPELRMLVDMRKGTE